MTQKEKKRIGEVYCIEIEGVSKIFLQYVAISEVSNNSTGESYEHSVVKVFKTKYPIDYSPILDDILKGEVAFYTYSHLETDIYFKKCYKVGKVKNFQFPEEEASNVWFILPHNASMISLSWLYLPSRNYKWIAWNLNGEKFETTKFPEDGKFYEFGGGMRYDDIISRIVKGYFEMWGSSYFDYVKRVVIDDSECYVRHQIEGKVISLSNISSASFTDYFHFKGNKVVREMLLFNDGRLVKLTKDKVSQTNVNVDLSQKAIFKLFPKKDLAEEYCLISNLDFGDINWEKENFIEPEQFESLWRM